MIGGAFLFVPAVAPKPGPGEVSPGPSVRLKRRVLLVGGLSSGRTAVLFPFIKLFSRRSP